MNKKIIVFDFDKTLTYKDTLFDFFCFVAKKSLLFPFKIFIYFLSMLLTKLGILSNTSLKIVGIYLFLKGMHKSVLKDRSIRFSEQIELNSIYHNINFSSCNKIIILSASFEDYLSPIFPESTLVLGSTLRFHKEKVSGLKQNCYMTKKAELLLDKGIFKIDEIFTDSFSDYCLAAMSKKIIIVKGDKTIKCNNINEFKLFFKK